MCVSTARGKRWFSFLQFDKLTQTLVPTLFAATYRLQVSNGYTQKNTEQASDSAAFFSIC
jgi:hypothetical protein